MLIKSKNVVDQRNVFYTDDNGYLLQRRQKDYREGYNLKYDIKVAYNYYPITSMVFIENPETKQRLTLLTDRPQGVTSLEKGEIEVMIHRVCLMDDGRGVGEVLREKGNEYEGGDRNNLLPVSTRHVLHFSQPGTLHITINIHPPR